MTEIALKIQRRRYPATAAREVEFHDTVHAGGSGGRFVIKLREVFVFDGHTCMAFEKHGRSLAEVIDNQKLSRPRIRRITRQMLSALADLHARGLTHTDVKAGNILYTASSGGEARLADLGNVRSTLRQGASLGSREYLAPEILIGAPLTPRLDLWSLGCCVYEMLTGRVLFDPRRAAAKKYREFQSGPQGVDVPLGPAALADEAEEIAEQYSHGTIIAGKYQLRRELGRGRFATVWSAEVLHDEPLPREWAEGVDQRTGSAENDADERAWRATRGAKDLLDLALNHEHVILISRLCGPFPKSLVTDARFRNSFFEDDGEIRFRPRVGRLGVRERLRRATSLRGKVLDETADFLSGLLTLDPANRPDASRALEHPWVATADI